MKKSEKLKLRLNKLKEEKKKKLCKEEEKKKQDKINIEIKKIKLSRNWKEKIQDHFTKKKLGSLCVINMELANGRHRTFYIAEADNSFKWKGNRYIFDPVMKYYNNDFGLYCYDYHEKFNLPIRRVFPINDVKTAIESSSMIESEYATNPSTLERFMNSAIIEMMLRGGAIDKMIKIIVIIISIVALISLIHLILYMYQSGVFENLNI